jgi:hypothetical protein
MQWRGWTNDGITKPPNRLKKERIIALPGQDVLNSGIYNVLHDAKHAEEHEVTRVYGKRFPPCNHCGKDVRFVLVIAVRLVELDKHFKKA